MVPYGHPEHDERGNWNWIAWKKFDLKFSDGLSIPISNFNGCIGATAMSVEPSFTINILGVRMSNIHLSLRTKVYGSFIALMLITATVTVWSYVLSQQLESKARMAKNKSTVYAEIAGQMRL
jgi:hypothetical protein